jgi:hypothetical protein
VNINCILVILNILFWSNRNFEGGIYNKKKQQIRKPFQRRGVFPLILYLYIERNRLFS